MLDGMENSESSLIPYESKVPAEISSAVMYLSRIRAEWQANPLVRCVTRLLPGEMFVVYHISSINLCKDNRSTTHLVNEVFLLA